MKRLALAVMMGMIVTAGASPAEEAGIPAWAYPRGRQEEPFPSLPPEREFHVAGSALVFTGEQLNKMDGPVDWLPDDHPAAPAIVAQGDHGRKIEACAACHGMSGQGSLETPSLAGLPKAYIAEQLREFAGGRRHAAMKDYQQSAEMIEVAEKLSRSDIDEAAGYFASLRPRRHVRVVESDSAPTIRDQFHGWQELAPEGGTQPVGRGVFEVAEDFYQLWIGDPHAEIVAYVSPGSIERGKALVRQAAQPCTSCHGPALKGMGNTPSLAGRDPHYLARALWDIKTGARGGPAVALMQKPTKALTADQIADIVAYLASLPLP